MKTLTTFVAVAMIAFGANQYEKNEGSLIDIGRGTIPDKVEVARDWQYFPGQLVAGKPKYFTEDRSVEKASCVIDGLGRESCPIDAQRCGSRQETRLADVESYRNGRKVTNSVCDAGFTYDIAKKLCAKKVISAYPANLNADVRDVYSFPAEQGRGGAYPGSSSLVGKSFSFFADKHSSFGPFMKGHSDGNDGHWTVVMRLKMHNKTSGKEWEENFSWSIGEHGTYRFGPRIITLPSGDYEVTFLEGGNCINRKGAKRCSVTSADFGGKIVKASALSLKAIPCYDGGERGNAGMGQDPNKCYNEKVETHAPRCPSGYTKESADVIAAEAKKCKFGTLPANCSGSISEFASYMVSENNSPEYGPLECKRDYKYPLFECSNDANTYGYGWQGPKQTENDCKAACGYDGCYCPHDNSSQTRAQVEDNCYRGNFECPIDPSMLCAKSVDDGECAEGESVTERQYRPLNKIEVTGSIRVPEQDQIKGYDCGTECGMNISSIRGSGGSALYFENGLGEQATLNVPGCVFNGSIDANASTDEQLQQGKPSSAFVYLSSFRVLPGLKSIGAATRAKKVYDKEGNFQYSFEKVGGTITSSCEILGAVGHEKRYGGITAVKTEGARAIFWDSYLDGDSGFIEFMPVIQPKDKADGFDYININAAKLVRELGFSVFYSAKDAAGKKLNNGIVVAMSSKPISADQCAKAADYGFSPDASADGYIYKLSGINAGIPVNNGNSWCVVAAQTPYGDFTDQRLSYREIVHDACDVDDLRYDAKPICQDGYLYEKHYGVCAKSVTVSADATPYCKEGFSLNESLSACRRPIVKELAATTSCNEGTTQTPDGCESVEVEAGAALAKCEKNVRDFVPDYYSTTSAFKYNQNTGKCEGRATRRVNATCPAGLTLRDGRCLGKEALAPTDANVPKDLYSPSSNSGKFGIVADCRPGSYFEWDVIWEGLPKAYESLKTYNGAARQWCREQGGKDGVKYSGRYTCPGKYNIYANYVEVSNVICPLPTRCEDPKTPYYANISGKNTCYANPSCPSGMSRNGDYCYDSDRAYSYEPLFTCDEIILDETGQKRLPKPGENWKLNGNRCSLTTVEKESLQYSCEQGELDYDKLVCLVPGVETSPIAGYTCKSGYTLDKTSNKCKTSQTLTGDVSWECAKGGTPQNGYCVKDPAPVKHICSPYVCNDDKQCASAKCNEPYDGSTLPPDITPAAGECVAQACDGLKPYVRQCGIIEGCENIQTEEGCFDALCVQGEFDKASGMCRVLGCPQFTVKEGDRCYK
jgi:hypothetical protein